MLEGVSFRSPEGTFVACFRVRSERGLPADQQRREHHPVVAKGPGRRRLERGSGFESRLRRGSTGTAEMHRRGRSTTASTHRPSTAAGLLSTPSHTL